MDEWLEEDEPLVKHVRDPYHRVDVRETSRHVRVSLEGQALAESGRAKLLIETSLPPRFYLPPEHVEPDLSQKATSSPSARTRARPPICTCASGRPEDDLAWSYREPLHDALAVRDMIAFYNERVDLDVDGRRWDRPVTGWSR